MQYYCLTQSIVIKKRNRIVRATNIQKEKAGKDDSEYI